jgi:hypothetical protein
VISIDGVRIRKSTNYEEFARSAIVAIEFSFGSPQRVDRITRPSEMEDGAIAGPSIAIDRGGEEKVERAIAAAKGASQ